MDVRIPHGTYLSRRRFLTQAGLAWLAVVGGELLASCQRGAKEARPTSGATIEPATLRFVGWQGYDGKPAKTFPVFTEWMEEHGIEVESTYVQDNEEMLTKIQASPPGTYDLTSPYHGTVPTMILAGVLEPIDTSRLTNWTEIFPELRGADFIRDEAGKIYAVPFTFSYQVALYNADRAAPLDSFAQLVDDPSLRGRFVLLDAPENFTWMAKILGLGHPDPHHLTPSELEEVQAYARRVIDAARVVAGSYGDLLQLLVAGEVDYSVNGTADQVEKAQAQGVDIRAFFPQEGTEAFVDTLCIPRGSQHYDTALAWIDEMLTARVQVEVAHVYGGAVVNLKAVPLLPERLRNLYDYDNLATVFASNPLYPPIPAESDEFATYADWTHAWNEVKGG